VLAATGLVFGSVYSLCMIHRAYFGQAKAQTALPGLKARELVMVLGLAVLLILLGVYPQPVLDTSAASMQGVQQWLGAAFSQLEAR
jgi:NADH-quinone oxidoreductase subunit M